MLNLKGRKKLLITILFICFITIFGGSLYYYNTTYKYINIAKSYVPDMFEERIGKVLSYQSTNEKWDVKKLNDTQSLVQYQSKLKSAKGVAIIEINFLVKDGNVSPTNASFDFFPCEGKEGLMFLINSIYENYYTLNNKPLPDKYKKYKADLEIKKLGHANLIKFEKVPITLNSSNEELIDFVKQSKFVNTKNTIEQNLKDSNFTNIQYLLESKDEKNNIYYISISSINERNILYKIIFLIDLKNKEMKITNIFSDSDLGNKYTQSDIKDFVQGVMK